MQWIRKTSKYKHFIEHNREKGRINIFEDIVSENVRKKSDLLDAPEKRINKRKYGGIEDTSFEVKAGKIFCYDFKFCLQKVVLVVQQQKFYLIKKKSVHKILKIT